MSAAFAPVPYASLNARQQENYNFHQVAARLAGYGYNSLRLTDDFEGADFIALHVDGETVLKVQLKGRLTVARKYVGKGVHVAFRLGDRIFVYPHDAMLEALERGDRGAGTSSWEEGGAYSWPRPPAWAMAMLEDHAL